MIEKYEDIIQLPHPKSSKHPQMSMFNRAAQFSPFAALTGHNAAIKETARLTTDRIELDEYSKELIRVRLQLITEKIKEEIEYSITYFRPDGRKVGGTYLTITGRIKKIDQYKRWIVMMDGHIIPMDDISMIDGEIFEYIDN